MNTHITLPETGAAPLSAVIGRARLNDLHDCLVLALDASENRHGYSAAEREARSYIRAALRHAIKLMEAGL